MTAGEWDKERTSSRSHRPPAPATRTSEMAVCLEEEGLRRGRGIRHKEENMNQRKGKWGNQDWELEAGLIDSTSMWQFLLAGLWVTTNTLKPYSKRPELWNGKKPVFLDQCCEELDVKVLSEIKGIVQFYSQHAACSQELFTDLWIDARGEKRMIQYRQTVAVEVLWRKLAADGELRSRCSSSLDWCLTIPTLKGSRWP